MQKLFVTFFGDAFLSAIMRWVKEGMNLTPDQFMEKIHKLTLGLAEKVIEDENIN